MPSWTRIAMVAGLAWLMACSGVQVWEPGKAPPAENQSGWEELPEPEPEEELEEAEDDEAHAEGEARDGDDGAQEAAQEPEPSGPATVVIEATVKGEPVPAAARVLDGDAVVASGKSGEALTVAPGHYVLEAAIEDSGVIADRPSKRTSLALRAGATLQQPMAFPWAAIQLRVRVNGKLNRSATVDIIKNGEVVATLKSDQPHVMFTPGRYDAKVRVGGAKIDAPQLLFPEGATRTVPVDVQM